MTYQSAYVGFLSKQSKLVLVIIHAGLFLFLPFLLPEKSRVEAVVVINEIFPKPAPPPDDSGEWIELYNTGPDPVSLGNWRLESGRDPKSSFTMSTSSRIPVNGIITLYESQTGIKLNDEGDEVKLFDPGNNQVDSQNYPSTLGFKNSVGRSTDGAGTWTICEKYTPNHLNENFCPAPTSPPATPTPTSTPLPTPTQRPTQITSPTQLPTMLPTFTLNPVLTSINTPEPTLQPSPLRVLAAVADLPAQPTDNKSDNSRLLGIAALATGIGLGFVALIGWLVNRHKHKIQ